MLCIVKNINKISVVSGKKQSDNNKQLKKDDMTAVVVMGLHLLIGILSLKEHSLKKMRNPISQQALYCR